jgi:cyclic pyranopterin phosphate synthase
MPQEQYPDSYVFLDKKDRLTFEEITRLAKIFVSLGVRKIRLTGGEPLLRKGLPDLIRTLNSFEALEDLALTTNGYWLEKQATLLKKSGLHRVTVSLDALDDTAFGRMNGRGFSVERILAGIAKAQEVGLFPVKVNVLLQKGVNEHSAIDIARYFKGSEVIVRFLEYMDVGNRNGWELDQVVSSEETEKRINKLFPLAPLQKEHQGEVANRHRYADGSGEVGFISSVSKPFCSSCNRARLSSDGKLYSCLFATNGTDLRAPLRNNASDSDLKELIMDVWRKRTDRYSDQRLHQKNDSDSKEKIEMYQIGG